MVDIKSVARKVIQDETVAIQNLINYIDDDFEAVVRLIYENKGRVIITGIGKSAIIATKIVATIGKDKCDCGWFASYVLSKMGFDVIESKYEDTKQIYNINISTSELPLIDKIKAITGNIIEHKIYNLKQVEPKFGFWGVPPNDLSILELFPNNTHVYGWSRCVEAGCPANLEMETTIDENVPTVFYSQAFCAKSQLAKFLADKYNGLYIDIDDYSTSSVKAKIEAFLRLR